MTNCIETQNLRKEFDDLIAVSDVNLQIPQSEICALIGPNGAGKTTLMKMICGLLEPTSGKVIVNGVDVWEQNLDANAYMAFLPDFFSCYPNLKVWEYLDYFAHAYKLPEDMIAARIDKVLELVNLTDKKDTLTKTLSRGMQQRLGIAKSIIHSPRLLVLDEPAAGLDPNARADLSKLLVRLKEEGVTILVSSHILSELADFSTSVIIMERGRLAKSGSIKQIIIEEKLTQHIILEHKGDAKKIGAFLAKKKSISDLQTMPDQRLLFAFSGDDDALVDLLQALVTAKFPIIGFSKKEQGIQDIFTKVTEEAKK